MNYSISLFFLLIISAVSGYGQDKLIITPEFPQQGQTITIRYNPSAKGATISDTVSHIEMKFTYSNFFEMAWNIPLSKKDDYWETSFTIPRYGAFATFLLLSGKLTDQPAPKKHYEIAVYNKNKQRVEKGYLYEGYSLSAQQGKSPELASNQAALYEEELEHYPKNYEARLRLLNYKISVAKEADKAGLRKKAENIIANKFREKPGNMGYLNLTTMGYLIIGENSRLDSIRAIVKNQYPKTEAGYEIRIDEITENADKEEMVKRLLAVLKEENSGNAKYLKSAHTALFNYYATKKNTTKALYHLLKTGQDDSPYKPATLKKQAETLYMNDIALDKAMFLATEALKLANKFPAGLIRYFPETGYLPAFVDAETRKQTTEKAKGNLLSLIGLIKMKQRQPAEATALVKKALSTSRDGETLANAGDFYQQKGSYETAFNLFREIVMKNPEDTIAFKKMKKNYLSANKLGNGLTDVIHKIEAHWKKEMKSELLKEMINVASPDFISSVVDLKGNPVSSDLIKNKIVVVDYWATWCVPCMKEMPYLEKAYEKYKNNPDVVFMVINSGSKNELSDAQDWWGNRRFSFPVYYNKDREIGEKLGFTVIPATFIVDTKNSIRFKTVGFEGPVIERKIPAAIELLIEDR